jgi:hypothetical protein
MGWNFMNDDRMELKWIKTKGNDGSWRRKEKHKSIKVEENEKVLYHSCVCVWVKQSINYFHPRTFIIILILSKKK